VRGDYSSRILQTICLLGNLAKFPLIHNETWRRWECSLRAWSVITSILSMLRAQLLLLLSTVHGDRWSCLALLKGQGWITSHGWIVWVLDYPGLASIHFVTSLCHASIQELLSITDLHHTTVKFGIMCCFFLDSDGCIRFRRLLEGCFSFRHIILTCQFLCSFKSFLPSNTHSSANSLICRVHPSAFRSWLFGAID
jgi:hypothetical protein